MKALLLSVTSLLLSATILLIGHGLQLTLVPLHAADIGWSTEWVGYLASFYFLGFVAGCVFVPKMVSSVGHIRVFAGLSACAAASLLLIGVFELIGLWLVGRFVMGASLAGLYMVIESWLNERVTQGQRGTVLSIYAIITAISVSVGQLLIGLDFDSPPLFFMLAAVFLVGGILPVALTRAISPKPIPAISFHPRKLLQVSSIAVLGAFLAGITTGGYWALGPLFARKVGLPVEQIGVFMSVAV